MFHDPATYYLAGLGLRGLRRDVEGLGGLGESVPRGTLEAGSGAELSQALGIRGLRWPVCVINQARSQTSLSASCCVILHLEPFSPSCLALALPELSHERIDLSVRLRRAASWQAV